MPEIVPWMNSCKFESFIFIFTAMISNYTVVTIPQWAIFCAITVIIYGWTEKKNIFIQIGMAIFILLGIYSAWAVYAGIMVPENFMNATDPVSGEELFSPGELPLEGKLIPVYWGFILNGCTAGTALIAGITGRRFTTVLRIISAVFSVLLFFMMIAIVRRA